MHAIASSTMNWPLRLFSHSEFNSFCFQLISLVYSQITSSDMALLRRTFIVTQFSAIACALRSVQTLFTSPTLDFISVHTHSRYTWLGLIPLALSGLSLLQLSL